MTMHREHKPVAGYFGVHVGFMLSGDAAQLELYQWLAGDFALDPRSSAATVAPYISLQIYYHAPVQLPAIRPASLYTLPATYASANAQDVLVNKRPSSFFYVSELFSSFARLHGKPFRFVDTDSLKATDRTSYQDWACFRAAVYLPYMWLQTMTFYDWANMGIPLFVPNTPLYAFAPGTNARAAWTATMWEAPRTFFPHQYNDWDDYAGRVYWWALTDFCALPGVIGWSSVPELLTGPLSSDSALQRASGQLRAGHIVRVSEATVFWRETLVRALG